MSETLDFSRNSRGDELARINADGTTTYNWGLIAQHAATWEPGSTDIGAYLAKLLLPLRPDVPEADFGNMAQQEPVASIYVTVGGAREFDDWRCPLPVGRNLLYTTTPPARKPLSQEQIKGAVIDDPFGGAALMSMMRDGVMVGELLQAIERIARAVERAHGIGGNDE